MIKTLVTLFLSIFISTTASAHTGMEPTSLLHAVLHLSASVGIYIAMMLAGLYLFNRLPKAKKQKIKVRVKK